MKRTIRAAAVTLILVASGSAQAATINIDFDTDANGSAINAPPDFLATTALTDLYASLGVIFSGPGGNDGGAILNQSSGFGINALSSPNFLAFNIFATLSNGGTPQGPETITFATPASSVSIYAGSGSSFFTLTAFNASNSQIAQDIVTNIGGWNLLSVSASGITSVTISGSGSVFVLDNLTVMNSSVVPEPASLTLLGLGAASLLGFSALKKRQPTV